MSKTKGGGSTRNGRDSNPQYLGVKVFDGTAVKSGAIIVRQRGSKIHPGTNVGNGGDDTLFATAARQGEVRLPQGPKAGRRPRRLTPTAHGLRERVRLLTTPRVPIRGVRFAFSGSGRIEAVASTARSVRPTARRLLKAPASSTDR